MIEIIKQTNKKPSPKAAEIEKSVMMEILYICSVLCGSYQQHVALELWNVASATEELNFKLYLI